MVDQDTQKNQQSPSIASVDFDPKKMNDLGVQVSKADEKLATELLKANLPLIQKAMEIDLRISGAALPVYERTLRHLNQNPWWDKARLCRDVVVTSMAAVATYKAGRFVVGWVKGFFA